MAPSAVTGTRHRRGTLSRDRILATALHIADTHGPDALTMRRVATELGVDPMALYRHVHNKDALLDGVVDKLWDEVPAPPRRDGDWTEPLRAFAFGLRAVISNHPRAAALLLTRHAFARRPLEAFDTLLGNIRGAGYDDDQAAQILRSVISTAYADAFATLAYRCPGPTSDAEALIALSQLLPPDTPAHLVRTAHTICGTCEPDTDFTFVLDLILTGADRLKRHEQP